MLNSNQERAGLIKTCQRGSSSSSKPRNGPSVSYGGSSIPTTDRSDANFIRQLDPESLVSDEECSTALLKIEEAIAKIETQLDYGGDEDWQRTANAALRHTKAKRNAVQRRREDLIRKWKRFWTALENKFGHEAVRGVWRSLS